MARAVALAWLCLAACSVDRSGLGTPGDDGGARDATTPPVDAPMDVACIGEAPDVCDGLDNDCNPETPDGSGDPRVGTPCDGPDADLCKEGTSFCARGALGCTDTTPDTPEICNGVDDDCDGMIDEAGALGATRSYRDADGDGYGDPSMPTDACSTPPGNVATGDDCNDANADVHPGLLETCNGIDDDCNGMIDDGAGCPCDLEHYGTHAYLFCDAGASFADAEAGCRAYGYWLVTIGDDAENLWVATTAKAIDDVAWWIGADDLTVEGTWVWISGLPETYPPHWHSGQPDGGMTQNCAVTLGAGDEYWFDRSCSDLDPFVCESPGT